MRVAPAWPHFGHTAALNAADQRVSISSVPPGQRAYEQVADTPETLYGSEAATAASCSGRLRTELILAPSEDRGLGVHARLAGIAMIVWLIHIGSAISIARSCQRFL